MKCRPPPTCAHCLEPTARHACRMVSTLTGRERVVALCEACEIETRPTPGQPRLPGPQPLPEPRAAAEVAESAAADIALAGALQPSRRLSMASDDRGPASPPTSEDGPVTTDDRIQLAHGPGWSIVADRRSAEQVMRAIRRALLPPEVRILVGWGLVFAGFLALSRALRDPSEDEP